MRLFSIAAVVCEQRYLRICCTTQSSNAPLPPATKLPKASGRLRTAPIEIDGSIFLPQSVPQQIEE
jgi:hypothetical protein